MNDEIEYENDPIEDFALLDNAEEEYDMIHNTLYEAATTAMELRNAIFDLTLMCKEAKYLKVAYTQLKDMEYEPYEAQISDDDGVIQENLVIIDEGIRDDPDEINNILLHLTDIVKLTQIELEQLQLKEG